MRNWHSVVSGLIVLSVSCGSDSESPDAGAIAKVGDTTAFGVVWSLTFDANDNPLIGTQNGVHRFD